MTPCSKPPGPRHRHNHPEHEKGKTTSCMLFTPGEPRKEGFGSRAKWTRRGGSRVWKEGGGTLFADPFSGRAMSSTRAVLEIHSSSPIPTFPSSHFSSTRLHIRYTSLIPYTLYSIYISSTLDHYPLLNSTSRNGAVRASEGRPAQDGAAVSWDRSSFAQDYLVLIDILLTVATVPVARLRR
jgi:hypothetical protein